MKCYVINCAQDTERILAFYANWCGPLPCERIDAIDGRRVMVPRTWKHHAGAWGLYETYIRQFDAKYEAPFAIFEDDAQLAPEWWAYVEEAMPDLPNGWWMLFLGVEVDIPHHWPALPTAIGDHLLRIPHGWRTHAVVYNPDALRCIVAAMKANPIPVDQVWADLMLKGSRNFYATRKLLAGCREGTSTITGIKWDREWHGPLGIGQAQHRAFA